MNNYPGYSHPHSSSPIFPAYDRQRTSPNETALESLRQQLFDSNDRFQINTGLSQNRLKSHSTNASSYPQIQNPQLPRDGHSTLNNDSPIYRREKNGRYDFEKEHDLLRSQGFSHNDRRNPPHFRTGDLPANASRADAHQSHDIYSDYSRRSFHGERVSPYNEYNNRERLSQRQASDAETRIQREQAFNRFPTEVNYHNKFPSKYIGSPVSDYPDSSSLRNQSLVQHGLYGDIPTSRVQPGLSREEEILKEIKALQQQQKLQELLNVSLSLAKQMKPSTVLEDFERPGLSNNTSSSIPDTFINKDVSKDVFLNERQDTDIFPNSKPFISPISNPSDSMNPTLDVSCNSSNNVSNSTEVKDSAEIEKVCASSESPPDTLISASKISLSPESSKQDTSIPSDSVNSTGLNKELSTSSASKSIVSGDNTSEWPLSHSIPFLWETTDNRTVVKELGLTSSDSQKLEQTSNSSTIYNHNQSGESNILVKSNLEGALVTLEIVDPVVGLDFIIESKGNVSVDGSFAFYCQLCNSSITRSLIIYHILSYKHRIRFVKIKDEDLYEHITSQKVQQCEKEEEVYKAAVALEHKYGRGRVVVQDELSTTDAKKRPSIKINFRKVHDSPKPAAFELNNEIDLEQRKFSGDVNAKTENSISNDGMDISSPTETPAAIPKTPCPVSSHANSNNAFSRQGLLIKSEITHVPVKGESLIDTTSLKHDTNRKVTVESLLSSKFNLNDAVFSNVISALKRPASPSESALQKRVKTEDGSGETEFKSLCSDISLHKDSDLGDSSFISQSASQSEAEKKPLMELLQDMTKWEISSNEEAEMISKTVDVLLKLLLRYKLRQEPSDEMEKVMKSFLSSHLEKSHVNSDTTKNSEQFAESTLSKANEHVTAPMEIIENKISKKTYPGQSSPPQEISKTASNSDTVSTSQPSNATLLQPPPFFCWPKSSTPPTSRPVAKAETNWSSQYAAALYAYPQQGYVGIPSMYQPYTLPIAHCVAPMPIQMALPGAVPMSPIPPPPTSTPPPLPSKKGPSLPPPPPPNDPPPPSGPPVVHPPLPPPPSVSGLPVPPPTDSPPMPPLPPPSVSGLPVPPPTDSPPMPPLPPSESRPPLPP